MASSILDFLSSRPEDASSRLIAQARKEIEDLKQELDASPDPQIERLSAYRLLASGTLQKEPRERGKWDLANQLLFDALLNQTPLDFDFIRRLNSVLRGEEAQLRTVPIYACGETYLAPEELPQALACLEKDILLESDSLVRASRIYIWTICAHPFLDANGRTARLAADYVLLAAGYLPLCFHSTVNSHVGWTQERRGRSMDESILKCLHAIIHAYHLVLGRLS